MSEPRKKEAIEADRSVFHTQRIAIEENFRSLMLLVYDKPQFPLGKGCHLSARWICTLSEFIATIQLAWKLFDRISQLP
jgi:hypothetical protein